MSDKTLQLDQVKTKDFILLDKNGILITLELPKALQINQNRQETYSATPVIHNNSLFQIESTTFTVELLDVIDASSNAVASVRWWDPDIFEGKKKMTFSCKGVKPGETSDCESNQPEYTQIRWNATVSSGRGVGKFSSILSLVELKYGPGDPIDSPEGPVVQIG